MSAISAGHDHLLRRVAAHGLAAPGLAAPGPLLAEPLEPGHWQAFLLQASGQSLVGLLWDAVETGSFPVTAAQRREIADAHCASMTSAVLLERVLVDTVALLDGEGVDHRVLKGSAVAHLDYPDPQLRPFRDVDLLVRGERFDDAVAALVAAGHRRRFPEARPGFDRRFSKGASFTTPHGFEIDLHRTFVLGPFGLTVDLADVWASCVPFTLAGRALLALGPEERFLNACLHAVLGDAPPRLLALRDVAQMLRGEALDQTRALSLATSWRTTAAVALAITSAWDAFALAEDAPLVRWARRHAPARGERLALAVHLSPRSGSASKAAAALGAIPGLRAKSTYLWALAFPDTTYLAGRHRSRTRRWGHAFHEMLNSRRRR